MPRFMKEQVIVAGDGSGTNTVTSSVLEFQNSYGYAVQFNIAGTSPVGSARVQGSIDQVNWVDISTIAVSAVGTVSDNKDAIYWPFLRVRYIGTSGTSVVVNAFINTKGG